MRAVAVFVTVMLAASPALADGPAAPRSVPAGDAGEPTPHAGYLVGGLTSLLIGAGGMGFGIASSIKATSISNDEAYDAFLQSTPPGYDACNLATSGRTPGDVGGASVAGRGSPQEVAEKCRDAEDLETAQLIAYPIGIVGIGVGAVLMSYAFERPVAARDGSLSFVPLVSGDYAGGLFRARF